MEWHQLENFIAVAKHKHFTKAAQQQSISQPALSRSIMKLEQELGVQLFFREGRTVQLTKYGELFLKKAKQAQSAIQDGIAEIQEKTSADTGEITVAFLHTLGPNLIPHLIANYRKLYPNVTFQLYQGANDYVINQVEQGLADLCLSSPLVRKGRLEWTTLKTESLYLVVPINHRLANLSTVSFQSLKDEEFICFKKGYGLRYIFDEMCFQLNVKPKITFEGEETTTVAGFVDKGLGIAVLPKISEIKHDSLRFLEISDYPCKRTMALSTLSDEFLSPIAKRFKAFVIEYFATID
ncbi:LysR family transcriptional regulator [Bacillus sp. FJAT-29790]|uniref:LysR family transcriptional regulator n=1 Tax=Bacillus sp. FJAT-29790 TaxID=1895002 RepID=UPI001C2431C8|nr:LysR family transcriptional regulator [Bacillus sp. FJAT-29790]MBU8880572.1 LysR family transcriptional regulator [Bacillus sp. FJAT-29790]